jgi:hypothetical protein
MDERLKRFTFERYEGSEKTCRNKKKPCSRFDATDSLVAVFKKDTPGESATEERFGLSLDLIEAVKRVVKGEKPEKAAPKKGKPDRDEEPIAKGKSKPGAFNGKPDDPKASSGKDPDKGDEVPPTNDSAKARPDKKTDPAALNKQLSKDDRARDMDSDDETAKKIPSGKTPVVLNPEIDTSGQDDTDDKAPATGVAGGSSKGKKNKKGKQMVDTEQKRLREGLGLSAGLVEAVSAVANPVAQQTKAKLAQVKNDVAQKVGAAKIAAAQKKGQQTIQKVQQPKTESVAEAKKEDWVDRESKKKSKPRSVRDGNFGDSSDVKGDTLGFLTGLASKSKAKKRVKESVEHVNELEKKTLKSYAKKAGNDAHDRVMGAGGTHPRDIPDTRRKVINRLDGVKLAKKKIKESVEPVEETSWASDPRVLSKKKPGKWASDPRGLKKVKKVKKDCSKTESVEPVEELSREKLTAYAGAARKDLKHAKKHARDYGSSPGDAETARRYQVKRSMGIKKAEDRMAESVDPIVESTSSMLDFYARGHAPARAEDHDPAGVFDAPRPIYEDGGYIAENKFGVYQRGGSIGSKNDKPIKVHDDIQAAKDHAKRLRQTLSKGERGYYKMGYTVKKVRE